MRVKVYVANAINTLLIRYKYKAPNKNMDCPVATPYPAVQSGGIRAVAMATPGTIVIAAFLLLEALAIIPARPPKKAIKISKVCGLTRPNNSEVSPLIGVIKKYIVDVAV